MMRRVLLLNQFETLSRTGGVDIPHLRFPLYSTDELKQITARLIRPRYDKLLELDQTEMPQSCAAPICF